MNEPEWWLDWRVWILVALFAAIIDPILFKQMVNEIGMPAWKAVMTLTLGTIGSYIPGKMFIDRGG